MSVSKQIRKSGPRYLVCWRDERGRGRSKTFLRKADADAYDAQLKLAKRAGELPRLDAGKQRLAEFLLDWWRLHGEPQLAAATQKHYRQLERSYILPHLGHLPLRRITPLTIQQFLTDLADEGIGEPTITKTRAMLQGVLERAVAWEHIPTNPVRATRRSRPSRKTTIRAYPPAIIEQIRHHAPTLLDATLISVIAYSGARPGEALALTWRDIGTTLRIDKALALGETKDTKNRKHRNVRLLQPLRSDLAEWKLACGRPPDETLVFTTPTERPWSDADYRNWRKRVYQTITGALELDSTRPYDLRHSFASLLFAEGNNPAEIAEQMGHSLQTLLTTYVHIIEELRGQPQITAQELIRAARAEGHPARPADAARTS